MQDGEHGDRSLADPEEDGIGEPPQQRAPHPRSDLSTEQGLACDGGEGRVECTEELGA